MRWYASWKARSRRGHDGLKARKVCIRYMAGTVLKSGTRDTDFLSSSLEFEVEKWLLKNLWKIKSTSTKCNTKRRRCNKISSYSLIRTVDDGLLYCLLAKTHSSGELEPRRANSRSTSQTASSVRFQLSFLYVESAMAFKQYARDKSKIMTW